MPPGKNPPKAVCGIDTSGKPLYFPSQNASWPGERHPHLLCLHSGGRLRGQQGLRGNGRSGHHKVGFLYCLATWMSSCYSVWLLGCCLLILPGHLAVVFSYILVNWLLSSYTAWLLGCRLLTLPGHFDVVFLYCLATRL